MLACEHKAIVRLVAREGLVACRGLFCEIQYLTSYIPVSVNGRYIAERYITLSLMPNDVDTSESSATENECCYQPYQQGNSQPHADT